MDELLLHRAQRGDPEAFEQLMTPLEQMIWRVCWHYTGDREAASDCGQDTMIRIWRGLDKYHGDCAFETWVYRVAANCCIDWQWTSFFITQKRIMPSEKAHHGLLISEQNQHRPYIQIPDNRLHSGGGL